MKSVEPIAGPRVGPGDDEDQARAVQTVEGAVDFISQYVQ
jgi:hypothetical protein